MRSDSNAEFVLELPEEKFQSPFEPEPLEMFNFFSKCLCARSMLNEEETVRGLRNLCHKSRGFILNPTLECPPLWTLSPKFPSIEQHSN